MTTIETKDTCAEGFCPHVDPKKHFALIVAIVIMGMIIGSFVDSYLPTSLSNSKKNYEAGRQIGDQDGFNRAKSLVLNSYVGGMFKTLDDVRVIAGTVKSIDNDKIFLQTQVLNPFDDQTLSERTVMVASSTNFVKLLMKDQEKNKTNKLIDVQLFSTSTANLKDIKIGDKITINTSENIKNIKTFTADVVQIMPNKNISN